MLPLVVHQNGGEELGCSRWSFTRTVGRSPECPRPLHPLHKLTDRDRLRNINGEEELGCSRWSFTRINGREELGCSRWSFTRIVHQN